MVVPYIDTPRTEIDGNATYLTNGFRSAGRTHLSALDSLENSFATPSKDHDVIRGFGDGRKRVSDVSNSGTPRANGGTKSSRSALRQLPSAGPARGEFTPLMRSATKNNFLKNTNSNRGVDDPRTPSHLRETSRRSAAYTPRLPANDMSDIYEEEATVDEPTPLPRVASSSAQSTPMPSLLGRDGRGVLGDGQNMTLKEQERIIDRLDKDNWNLKLKIHYMEEQLEKAGPEYNSAALKENTELKVLRVTMQRDILRYKQSLQKAERDLEDYQQQLTEMRDKARRRVTDEEVQREMEVLREEIKSRDNELRDLREELRIAKESRSEEIEKLQDEIEDLEAAGREKDRAIEERDEELEELREKGQETNAGEEVQYELDRAKEQIRELQTRLEDAISEGQESSNAIKKALDSKTRAEEELQQLREEIMDKSFTTKGLNRQREDQARRLEEEIDQLRKINERLEKELENKTDTIAHLERRYQSAQHDIQSDAERLGDNLNSVKHERDVLYDKLQKALVELKETTGILQRRTEEKELLHTRHQALTDESGGLQNDLTRAQSRIRELQTAVEEATTRAQDSQSLQWQHKVELDRLQDEIESLQHEIEDKEGHFALEKDRWESGRRALEAQKERAEEQARGFKRTIENLQQAEHSLSGKESRLQSAIDSENQRHQQEEAVLNRQIQNLSDELSQKRQILDEQRGDLLSVREELRISRREEQLLKDKVQALEDEIVVLQSSLADEQEYAKDRVQKSTSELEGQLQRAIVDRQTLRDQLANAHVELHDMRTSIREIESERDAAQAQLLQFGNGDSTARFDPEKLELRRTVTRLESETKRLQGDRNALLEAKDILEKQLGTEIERATAEEGRLSAEIDRLQDRLLAGSGNRDRELASAKAKVQRFERRVQELETLLQQERPNVDHETSGTHGELSLVRQSLEEARKREKTLLQRETEQKNIARSLKSRVGDLERDLHEALMNKYDPHSPRDSPSNKLYDELRNLRKQLSEAHRSLKEMKVKNRDLERAAMREEDQRDLHELLKSSTIEAEALALKLSERDSRLNELKSQVQRIREERTLCARKAEMAGKELDALQRRYDEAVKRMANLKGSSKGQHEKEMRGLGKEIMWLRARLRREEKFRRDLAWSKGLMELGERVRIACNEADLRMISEMGVQARDRNTARTPRRKLKTAVSLVLATVRMKRMSQAWGQTKKIGEGLKRAKSELLKRRETSSKSLSGS
ncbi:Uncharacterized protein PECH_008831 [Penicillium ucsense]|uniref:Centrosomin N-terminal motif 1 domain-containing protein n=1 Tax=Penicillium ucsense TaxID=2839758 RepID=A0A8J8WAX3_9EURO|nr:Uncharacterized protein PECM_001514 [Penicillium ucsense]KAF7733894.1 Uncharacterized protein PECH_008831 [Penicillium ucsense]